MTIATIPNRPAPTDARAIAAILADFDAITTVVNGELDSGNLSATAAQAAGMNQASQVVKGSSIIATSEVRTNVAYGLMTTPDQVSGIVLPTKGLIAVWYQATWQGPSGTGLAGLFINSNQVLIAPNTAGGPIPQEAALQGSATNEVLTTYPTGLVTSAQAAGASYTGDVATGQILGSFYTAATGGPCYIFAAAGTYTISVQFKATSGSVTVSNRRLYCEVKSYT